jgi:hypothetical protein
MRRIGTMRPVVVATVQHDHMEARVTSGSSARKTWPDLVRGRCRMGSVRTVQRHMRRIGPVGPKLADLMETFGSRIQADHRGGSFLRPDTDLYRL